MNDETHPFDEVTQLVLDARAAEANRLAHFGRSCQNVGDKWQRELNALIHEANVRFKPIDVAFGQVRFIQKNNSFVGLQYPASGLRERSMLMFEVVAPGQVTVCLSDIAARSPLDADGPFPKTHISHALAHLVRLAALA